LNGRFLNAREVTIFTAFLLLLSIHLANAQREPSEFGEVTIEELKMKKCELDSSASAVILFQKGEIKPNFNPVTGSTFNYHIQVKIFSKDAYNEWGNERFTVERSTFSKLKGAVYYLENGAVVKSELKKENIFKKKNGRYLDEIIFTFPNLREGAVLEYTYNIALDYGALPSWQFQHSIPTLWSGYFVDTDLSLFRQDIRGALEATHTTRNKGKSQQWVMKNVPAFKSEPMMPHPGLYISTIRFWQQFASWNSINSRLAGHQYLGGLVSDTVLLKPVADHLTEGITNPYQKIKVISDYVKKTIAWDGTYDLFGDNLNEILNKKTGSSGDINVLFGHLLNLVHLKVNMVLISTRKHGLVYDKFPSVRQFNYVICRVTTDSAHSLYDATEKNLPFDELPARCLNYDGLSVSASGGEWVKIPSPTKFKTSVNADLTIQDSGEIKGHVGFVRYGYSAFEARETYEAKGKEAYVKDLFPGRSLQVEKSEFENAGNVDQPFKEEHDIVISNEVTQAGDLVYVNPILFLNTKSNPFIPEERQYPIDFGTLVEGTYVAALRIPNDYEVEEMPKTLVLKLPDNFAKCIFSYTQIGKKVFVTHSFQINKTLFMKEEYTALREFYSRVVSKMGEQLVLRKKK
jgi:hypothetical protein